MNGDNSIQRSSSLDHVGADLQSKHVGGDLQSKHVGQSLGVLPYSVFGERGMFGILVDGTNVSIGNYRRFYNTCNVIIIHICYE